MKVFGEDPSQVRALSAVISVATVPIVWHLGCRLGRKEAGDCAVVLFVTSPFAVRYASEARMYSLVMLLVCAGALLILRARRAPTLFNFACVAAVTCLLLLTHYWAIYLVTATIGGLVWRYWATRDRSLGRLVVSLLAGVVASLWWAPTFLYQLRRTGAPWANRPTIANLLDSLGSYAGRRDTVGTLLCLLLIAFLAVGVVARRAPGGPVEVGWASSAGRSLTLLASVVLVMALGAGMVVGAPVPARYTSVVFPLLLLAAATGIGLLHPTTRRSFLVVIAILGFIGSIPAATASRTEAGSIAAELETRVAPSDLIVYCPDQLAPAVSRLIPSTLNQLTFPDLAPPHFVDWVDYRSRVARADPVAFADAVDRLAGDNDIWLMVAPSYVAVGGPCREVQLALERSRWSSTIASYSPGEREGSTLERLRPIVRFQP
jgi:uncharacterized membrane protein